MQPTAQAVGGKWEMIELRRSGRRIATQALQRRIQASPDIAGFSRGGPQGLKAVLS
jgi:hypothetical protein